MNQVFGNRYQVTEKIGMGGMAEVYKATDSTLGRTVAVKVMLPQYASDPNFSARFKQEAQAAANLSSPYIVNIYDWGRDGDCYYIVMEHVRGTDLKTAIAQRGHIHPRKVAEIGSQVCSALSVAHGYDIIHRDIKSANIMVGADGNVKVMDFGIAQAGVQGMTQDSSVLGTAHYVSPEQAQGKTLAATSDLYSLGVVLYEASTGQLPFDGPDVVSVAMMQVQDEPVPPRQLNPEIDPAFEAIILRAMAKDPAARYSTATEMKHAIDDYLQGKALGAAETQVLSDASAVAAGATSVMPATAAAQSTDADSGSSKKKKKKKGKKKLAIVLILLVLLIALGAAFALGVFQTAETVTVPDVTDLEVEEATETLEDEGFEVVCEYENSDEVEEDYVISQDPEGGEEAKEGSTVTLAVSMGEETPETVEVPNLIGLTSSEAKAELSEVGLEAAEEEDYSSSYEAGTVFEQSPSSGEEVDYGSTVTYTLSLGEEIEEVNVPNVIGLTEESAISKLEDLGLSVTTSELASEYREEGTICDQSPEGGTTAEAGSTVTIYVSTGSEYVEVPDVVGMTKTKAKSTLTKAGFKVTITDLGGKTVTNQSPGSGSDAKSGSTVTITLEPDDSSDTTASAG